MAEVRTSIAPYLLHGGNLTWDELVLVLAASLLLGVVLMSGLHKRDERLREIVAEHQTQSSVTGADGTSGAPINVLDVSHRYGRDWALSRLDLSIAAGEFVAVLGANGAGKSTLLNILSTAEAPTSGDVVIGGVSLRADPDAVRGQVGIVAHQPLLYPHLTAEENLRFFATMFDLDAETTRRAIARVLGQVSMLDRRTVRVDRLSHGQRQRVAFARALLHSPVVLLLDEPYAGLDLVAAERLDALLDDLRGSGHTIVMTSHDFARSYAHADRVVIVSQGRITNDLVCDEVAQTDAELLYRNELVASDRASSAATAAADPTAAT